MTTSKTDRATWTDAEWAMFFDELRAARERSQARKQSAYAAALRAGRKLAETHADGTVCLWPDCSPYLPEYTADAEYIARHVAARESGFGFTVAIVEAN